MSEEACEEVGPGCFLFGKQQLAEGEERERESSKESQRGKERRNITGSQLKSANCIFSLSARSTTQRESERATRDTDRRSRHGSRVAWIVFIHGPSAFRCELEVY